MDDLKVIIRNLAKLGNEELLEVCLRKNLIPETRYEWMIKKCRRQSVALLPCLIAYKNQLKTRTLDDNCEETAIEEVKIVGGE